MKIIFEDKCLSEISQFILWSCYDDISFVNSLVVKNQLLDSNSSYERCIIFSDGVKNLRRVVQSVVNMFPEETIIVYMDVAPDNCNSCEDFSKLRSTVRRGNFSNVYIIPIPCIEYIVLKMLRGNTSLFTELSEEVTVLTNMAVDGGNYKRELLKRGVKTQEWIEDLTLERFCKFIVYELLPKCFCAKKWKGLHKSLAGAYFCEDCLCSYCKVIFTESNEVNYCKFSSTGAKMDLISKVALLIRELPVFISDLREGFPVIDTECMDTVIEKSYVHMEGLRDRMEKDGLAVCRSDAFKMGREEQTLLLKGLEAISNN